MATDAPWPWQLRHGIRDLEALQRRFALTASECRGVELASGGFHLLLTPYYADLADPGDPSDPIRLQCVPSEAERAFVPGDLEDPLGEVSHEVAPHLVRRYPDRALLLATDRCAVHCRHCTRRRRVGRSGTRSLAELEPALRWVAANPEVREVLLSGGDPLVAPDRWVEALLRRIRRISSVEIVRVGTRAPVVLPQRITPALCEILRRHAPLFVTTQFNHPREMTPRARGACELLADAGVPVANQTVLLRGVNDCARVQIELSRALLRARVRPYYLMQADAAAGTAHLRVPTSRGAAILATMRGRLSGLGLPAYVLDLPGGAGKVPVGPRYVEGQQGGALLLRSPRGRRRCYEDAPRAAPRCEGCLCDVEAIAPGGLVPLDDEGSGRGAS